MPQSGVPGVFAILKANGRLSFLLAVLGLLLSVLFAYQNIFDKSFVFDDTPTILSNPSIRQFWPPWTALNPSSKLDNSTTGRPLANYSFALNYAISGYKVWSYHALNLIIHGLATLVLFGVVRRTLLQPLSAKRWGEDALPLAFFTAQLWAVHPLLTEAVTYVTQRTESLAAFFYLLVVYCFIRSLESTRLNAWRVGAVGALLLGMASKETLATAPVMVLLYDRTFVAGSFRSAWRSRGKFYAALAGCWIFLAWLMHSSNQRAGTAGFGLGVAWWQYAFKQCDAIVNYVSLVLWPHPLILNYGREVVNSVSQVWPQVLAVGFLLSATGWALVRRPRLGFAGAWVFIILAPTSSVVPIVTETEAGHRMYLPAVALVAVAVLALYELAGRRIFVPLLAVALAWGVLTIQRNECYQSDRIQWQHDVAEDPHNVSAHKALGAVLAMEGLVPQSIQELRMCVALDPANEVTENYLGLALEEDGQLDQARAHFLQAVKLRPGFVSAWVNLGNIFKQTGQFSDAFAAYQQALHFQPGDPEVEISLGDAYNQSGQPEKGLPFYQLAVSADPASAPVHFGLGNTYFLLHQLEEAKAEFLLAIKIDPQDYGNHYSLGVVLTELRETPAARREFMEVLRMRPDFVPAQQALAGLPAN